MSRPGTLTFSGDGLCLNGSGVGITAFRGGTNNFIGQAESRKRHKAPEGLTVRHARSPAGLKQS